MIAVWTPCAVVSRSSLMSLIITFMFEPAKLQMNCARASGTSTRRRAAAVAGVGVAGGGVGGHRRSAAIRKPMLPALLSTVLADRAAQRYRQQ